MHPLLQQLQSLSKPVQMTTLLTALRLTRQQLSELQQHKLCFVEKGHLDVWLHRHQEGTEHANYLRSALEELTLQHTQLPAWMMATQS